MAITVKAVTISFIALATPSALHRQKKSQINGQGDRHTKEIKGPRSLLIYSDQSIQERAGG
jgi:hypothetical protein